MHFLAQIEPIIQIFFVILHRFTKKTMETSNALLIANGYCPLSFRTVDSIDYKKAMLIFYEQNNLHAFKQIFISQYEFAVKEYF